eukprot:TRINITY_DN3632_c0_g1_i1.p1 TRINITY_DN3632_c0_g1~~TRINITY_DN3632_c0_g1_i1.p1  ORF type:complete len:291 (+),score=123.06 TRINITY_DN3632_c0_g1_i1:41-913(+)
MSNQKPLQGQVAIVTGASRGIGRIFCLDLAKAGANIVVSAKSITEKKNLPGTIFSVAAEVEELGVEALPFQCDVRNDKQVAEMVEATLAKFGRIDILICNAGALFWKKMTDTPMDRYDLINGVNARGTFTCVKHCLPTMLEQKHGRIITCSPPINFEMLNGRIAYCLSKFGMTLVARGIAEEYKNSGVTATALWPATLIESFATINFKLGGPQLWRKPSILSDCVLEIVQESDDFNGEAVIDETYLRSKGVTDFTKYRCDPNCEPPHVMEIKDASKRFERGYVSDLKSKL